MTSKVTSGAEFSILAWNIRTQNARQCKYADSSSLVNQIFKAEEGSKTNWLKNTFYNWICSIPRWFRVVFAIFESYKYDDNSYFTRVELAPSKSTKAKNREDNISAVSHYTYQSGLDPLGDLPISEL